MVYFDRLARRTLSRIYRAGKNGYAWKKPADLVKRHPALDTLIPALHNDGYITNKDTNDCDIDEPIIVTDFSLSKVGRSFCTAKGREYLQRTALDSWRWFVPTFISLLALAVSIAALLLPSLQNV